MGPTTSAAKPALKEAAFTGQFSAVAFSQITFRDALPELEVIGTMMLQDRECAPLSTLQNTDLLCIAQSFGSLGITQKPELPETAIDIIASYSPDLQCARKAQAVLQEVFAFADTTTHRTPVDQLAMYRGHELELLREDLTDWTFEGIYSNTPPPIETTQKIGTTDKKRFEPVIDASSLQDIFAGLESEWLTSVIAFLLVHCPNLRVLDLSKSKVEQKHLMQLVGFKQLKVLKLSETQLRDADLAPLRQMAIEELDLSLTRITGHCLQGLQKSLITLTLSRCTQLDMTELRCLERSRLRNLDLSFNTNITDKVFDPPEADAGLSTNQNPTWLPASLVELRLISCPGITDAVVLRVISLTKLRILNLSRNPLVTKDHFDEVSKSLKIFTGRALDLESFLLMKFQKA